MRSLYQLLNIDYFIVKTTSPSKEIFSVIIDLFFILMIKENINNYKNKVEGKAQLL